MFGGIGFGAGREEASRGAEWRGEKAKNDQQRTEAPEEKVIANAHGFIVRGVRWEGNPFGQREHRVCTGHWSTLHSREA